MSKLNNTIESANNIPEINTSNWKSINPEYVARMRLQNQFKTCLLYTSDAADEP